MKANSLEELVTNSNIAGELRNYTDWHTRLVKFAQLVADWQKKQMMKDAVEAYIVKSYNPCTENSEPSLHGIELIYKDKNKPYLLAGDKVRIVILKDEEYGYEIQ